MGFELLQAAVMIYPCLREIVVAYSQMLSVQTVKIHVPMVKITFHW